jgi:UDP-N-acetylglucosamine 4,6-dehydratase/5-epimerase
VKVIGTRHGEKLYETLLTREERQRAEDMGDYYRVRADARDLNYSRYFVEGEREIAELEDYHSHNTKRLDVDAMCEVLLNLEAVQQALRGEPITE